MATLPPPFLSPRPPPPRDGGSKRPAMAPTIAAFYMNDSEGRRVVQTVVESLGRVCRRAMAALLVGGAAPVIAAEAAPAEHYTRPSTMSDVTLSPSGKRMAMQVLGPNGLNRLAVMDLDPISAPRVVGGFADASVEAVWWVNDDRLVYEAYSPGAQLFPGEAGVFAVNHDGSDQRTLIAAVSSVGSTGSQIVSKVLPWGWRTYAPADADSGDMLVYKMQRDSVGDVQQIVLGRLNTVTGRLEVLTHGTPKDTTGWALDANKVPRMVLADRGNRRYVYWRGDSNSENWTQVADFDALGGEGFVPFTVNADGTVHVIARGDGGTEGIYVFDPASKRLLPEPVLAVKGFDLKPIAEVDTRTNRLLGFHFLADRQRTFWLDPSLDAIQRAIDAALPPGRSNRLYCGACETSRFIVILSSSDTQPGEYFLFDRQKQTLELLGASRPWIDEKTQGRRTLHRVRTRDGLVIPVYVTHPAGSSMDKPLPTVVLVHGGPWGRGSTLLWDSRAQFLASRGYRVVEPEYRGSKGYGFAHFKAGFRQWGRAMQDDLADAVKWAVDQRLVDAGRVCIMGANYGGYAALMGAVAHQGTYRCAVSYGGFTDMDMLYGLSHSDFSENIRRHGFPVLIGDRDRDAEAMAAVSPIKRVADIKVPVLLAYGVLDRWAAADHAVKFAAAARRAGVTVEQVAYPDEAHVFFNPSNRADYYRRVERFLEKSLRSPD